MQEKLTLGGDGGGIFDVESRGAATLAATRMVTLGPPAAQVTDALAGRSTDAAVLSGLSARSSTAVAYGGLLQFPRGAESGLKTDRLESRRPGHPWCRRSARMRSIWARTASAGKASAVTDILSFYDTETSTSLTGY